MLKKNNQNIRMSKTHAYKWFPSAATWLFCLDRTHTRAQARARSPGRPAPAAPGRREAEERHRPLKPPGQGLRGGCEASGRPRDTAGPPREAGGGPGPAPCGLAEGPGRAGLPRGAVGGGPVLPSLLPARSLLPGGGCTRSALPGAPSVRRDLGPGRGRAPAGPGGRSRRKVTRAGGSRAGPSSGMLRWGVGSEAAEVRSEGLPATASLLLLLPASWPACGRAARAAGGRERSACPR